MAGDTTSEAGRAVASGPLEFVIEEGVDLVGGRRLERVAVTYETFGTLDDDRANAIVICHALSGDSHVAEGPGPGGEHKPGWWDVLVGPGKTIDTERYFVICANVLGGCMGTTGPGSIDPADGEPYGLDFPLVTIEDMVDVQVLLLDHLGIERVVTVTGGSMGGMQVLSWAKRHPHRVVSAIPVATTSRLNAQAIAFNEVGRTAILSDPDFRNGDYYAHGQPANGLGVARMVGHITYLSDESMRDKFGRKLRDRDRPAFEFVTEFEVESYLAYQGKRFVERFDANTYLYMTKAMDYFDLANGAESLEEALRGVSARFLVLSFSSDWLFPSYQSREIVAALRAADIEVTFAEIPSSYGHDAFLLEEEGQRQLIEPFLANAHAVAKELAAGGEAS